MLLLTNDGEIKRRMELPSTGWSRKYRVRIHGRPDDEAFAPLRKGITVDGERFRPMTVTLDRQQGSNAWATVTLREGRNREVRRAMEAIGLTVNRLIRVGYGPFQLGQLKPGEVSEVRPRIVRDRTGGDAGAAPRQALDTGAQRPNVMLTGNPAVAYHRGAGKELEMQRLVLAALLLAIIAGFVAVLVLGMRVAAREGRLSPGAPEGTSVQKIAFAALILLIAGVSTGLLGGL